MGIADDISPKRRKHSVSSELDRFGDSDVSSHHEHVLVHHPVTKESKKDHDDNPFTARHKDDDFFPPKKVRAGKKDLAKTDPPKTLKPKTSFSLWRAVRRLIFIALIALLSILIYRNFNQIKTTLLGQGKTGTADDTSGVEIVPQDYTSSIDSASTPSETSTTSDSTPDSTAATTPPATTTTPDKSILTIDLLNGNGISNTAATYEAVLTKAGYTVSAVGNAANFKYWSTYVYYKTGLEATAADLKTVLARKSTLLKNDDIVCKKYDIVIIIGSH